MNRLLISFAVVAAVACNDLIQGPEGGRKVYEANQQASPAIWKQKQEFTIKTNDSEVISRIVIEDRRPQKDGEAKIISGGQGKQNVTIELSSPTVFRGYDFHVEVYAAEDNGQQLAYPEESMYNDTDVNYGANKGDESTNINKPIEATRDTNEDKVHAPVATGKDTAPTMGQDKVVALVNADRKVRKTEQDSDSLQVKGMSTDKVTTDKTNAPADPQMTTEKAVNPNAPLNLANAESSDGTSRPRMSAEEEFIQLYGKDAFNHFRGDSESSEETSTTEGSTVVDTGIPKGQPKVFSDISKELGQKVVFGIKRV